MTPFQQSRVWFRRASLAQRIRTICAILIAVGLLSWMVVPPSEESQDAAAVATNGQPSGGATVGTTNPTDATGAAASTGAPPAASTAAGLGPGAPDAAPGARSGTAAALGGRTCPPGTDQGVTANEVAVAITIVNLVGAAGNSAFGVPSVEEQEDDWTQVADAANAAGGAGCRKIVPKFFAVNPADPNDPQQKCLDIAASKPFAAVDVGALAFDGAADCIPGQKIPLLTNTLRQDQVDKYYPYYFAAGDTQDHQIRNGMLGLAQGGFFSAQNGFVKLGFAYRSCIPQLTALMRQALREAKVPDDKTVPFDFGCPNGFASPATIQQAILKFQSEGVTHVTVGPFFLDFPNFTRVAQQQGFKPKYGFGGQDGLVATSSGALSPDHDNLDGAINITGSRYAEETTPGMTPSPGTAKCNAIYAAKGRPPVYKQSVGFGGAVCAFMTLFVELANNAPRFERSALVSAIPALKTIDFSFPYGPTDFASSGPRATYGRAAWRPQRFLKSCDCWRVEDPTFRPFFP